MSRIGYAFAAALISQTPLTVVKGKRIAKTPTRETSTLISKASNITQNLLSVPGMTLNQQGGVLAPIEIKWRGLSGSQLSMDLDGLTLNDPVSALFDAADLPLFALQSIKTGSGKLSFTLPRVDKDFLKTRFGYGSFSTSTFDLAGGAQVDRNLNFFVATQIGTSQGAFTFRQGDRTEIRANNDQHRVSALARASLKIGRTQTTSLIFTKWHEGGIVGIAGYPLDLRGKHQYLVASQDFQLPVKLWNLHAQLQGRFDQRSTLDPSLRWDDNRRSVVEFALGQLSLDATRFFSTERSMTLRVNGQLGSVIDSTFSRQAAGAQIDGDTEYIQASASVNAYSDVGILFNSSVNASMKPATWLLAGIRLSKMARPPTFTELYAPSGLLIGNPHLAPESVYESELYTQLSHESLGHLRLAAFYGYIDNMILFVNKNALEIHPINTSGAHKGGFDFTLNYTPHRLVSLDGNLQYIVSKLISTGAPLPTLPPWSTMISLRVGEVDRICGWLKFRYRDGVTSNLFGTLSVPPYWLLDAIVQLPITSSFRLNASVTNIFNVLTAQDSNQIPLPGRAFFVTLESHL